MGMMRYVYEYNGMRYTIEAPENSTAEDLAAIVEGNNATPKKDAGFLGSFMDSAKTLGLSDEATAFAANPNEQTRKAFLDAAESKYSKTDFGKGKDWEAFKELAGSSLGALVAPVAVGAGASALTTPVGGLAAASATSGTQYTIQNLLRQAQEQQNAVQAWEELKPVSVGKAVIAAGGQTALDLAAGPVFSKIAKTFPFMRPLLAEAGGKAAARAGEVLADAAKKGTITFAKGVAKGVGKGVAFEVPQEIAQQALERWQAGLGLADDDALSEYKQAAIGAAILGGGFGAIEGAIPETRAEAATKEEPSAPKFDRKSFSERLRAPLADIVVVPGAARHIDAVQRKLENDVRLNTPESLASSEAYLRAVEDNIDAGKYPDNEITPLEAVVKQARTILNERREQSAAGETANGKPTEQVSEPDGGTGLAVAGRDASGVSAPVGPGPAEPAAGSAGADINAGVETTGAAPVVSDVGEGTQPRPLTIKATKEQRYAALNEAGNRYPLDSKEHDAFYRGAINAPPDEYFNSLATKQEVAAYQEGLNYAGEQAPPVNAAPEISAPAVEPAAPVEPVTPTEKAKVAEEAAPPTPPPPPPASGPGLRNPANPEKPLSVPEFKAALELERKFSDEFADAEELTKYFGDLQDETGSVPEQYNLGHGFELHKTTKSGLQREIERKFERPLINKIAEAKVPLSDVATYLLSRAAPDRNRMVRAQNAAFPEGGSGILDAEAAENMAELKARGLLPKLEEIAAFHDKLVNYMLDLQVKNNLLSEEQAKALREEQPYYTPFKGFALDGDFLTADPRDDAHSPARRAAITSAGRGIRTKEFFSAMGRKSLPFHPLFNLLTDAEALARRVEMNKLYVTLLDMAKANPQFGSEVIANVYTDNNPRRKTIPSATNPAGKQIQVPMSQQVREKDSRLHVAKLNGQNQYIEFRSDTDAGIAAERLFSNLTPKEMSETMRNVTRINNALKGLLTYRNPLYLTIVAPARDISDAVATALHNQNVKGSPLFKKGIALKVAKYSLDPTMWRTVTRWIMGREPVKGQEELMALLDKMIMDGGAPMQVPFKNAEEKANAAVEELKRLEGVERGDSVAITKQAAHTFGKFFDHWAEINDIVPRFATYRAATEANLTGRQAASLSLDSSLNLTRRGEYARLMDNLIPFFSAGVEGSRKVVRIATNPRSVAKVIGGMVALGIAESLANATFGGDDDDDGVPDYLTVDRNKRMSRLVVSYGGGDKNVSLPIGQMLGYFKYIGNKIADTWMGVSSGEGAAMAIQDASFDVAAGVVSLMSPARIQGGDLQSTLASLTPLIGKPVVDVVRNKNFFGTPIYTQRREGMGPRSELGQAATADFWKGIATSINQLTGGSPATSGYVDIQPEVYEYLINTYLGGAARLVKQVGSFAEEPTTKNAPVLQGFLGIGFDYAPQNRFRKNTKVIADVLGRGEKLSDAQLVKLQASNPVALDPDIVDAYIEVDRSIDRLYRERAVVMKEAKDSGERKLFNDYYLGEMNKLWSAFNYTYEKRRVEQSQ